MKPLHIAVTCLLCLACALGGYLAATLTLPETQEPSPRPGETASVDSKPSAATDRASAIEPRAERRRDFSAAISSAREAAAIQSILDGDEPAIRQWRERRRVSRGGAIRVGKDGEMLPEDDERTGPLTESEKATLKTALDELKYGTPPLLDFASMKPGDFGVLSRGQWRFDRGNVLQVIDDKNLIARVFGDGAEFRFWLSNASTAGIVDGSALDVSGFFECVGTKQYSTVAGSTLTIHHLRRVEE